MLKLEIVTLYLKKINILYEGKKIPAQTKLMTAKLRAVLDCAESDSQIFWKINMWDLVSQRYSLKQKFCSAQSRLSAVLACVESDSSQC